MLRHNLLLKDIHFVFNSIKMKVQALFKGSSKAAPAKKTAAPKKTSSAKSSGGWLGSASGDINLDKWYVFQVK